MWYDTLDNADKPVLTRHRKYTAQSPEPVGGVHVHRLQLHIILCLLHTDARCFEGKARRGEGSQRRLERLSLTVLKRGSRVFGRRGGRHQKSSRLIAVPPSNIPETYKTRRLISTKELYRQTSTVTFDHDLWQCGVLLPSPAGIASPGGRRVARTARLDDVGEALSRLGSVSFEVPRHCG
jgi:hypothetical protein